MLPVNTLNDVLFLATGRGEQTVLEELTGENRWRPISSNELYRCVRAFASALQAWGVGKGDRVVLLAENRWEWAVADLATLALGAVDVPLYATLTGEQIGYMVRDSGAKVAVLSSREQHEKLASAGDLSALEHIVVMDGDGGEGTHSFADLLRDAAPGSERDPAFDERARSVAPSDLATIIYTSGTTGDPKGVMLTHGNLASNLSVTTDPFGFTEKDRSLSFLPLSHVTARHVDYALMGRGTVIGYCPRFDRLPEAMKTFHPTIFVAVPRVYEKIRQAVEGKAGASKVRSRLLGWALGQGKAHREETLRGTEPGSLGWKLANSLVFAKIRQAFGGEVKTFISGGAPLGMDTAGWFADAGIRIFEGYGLSETSPVVAINYPEAHAIGTVGKPLVNVEVRFAGDGELEVRGPSIFHGYWQKQKETDEVFTPDGWFRTGDIGKLDEHGFVTITDRKKELLKTSGGKLIAPQPIENRLKANCLVAHAALVGDRHKFAAVLISPNFAALESWAKGNGVAAANHGKLIADGKVVALYQEVINAVNRGLPPYETIKRMCIVPEEWSVEEGELTPSMKLKRRVVEERYKQQIEAFYADENSAHAPTA